jgi:archaellum component FlaC
MTIDERLERLTERHEALTQTVELIAAAQIKNDERMGQVMDAMNRLANIKRIDRLEDRPQ